MTMTMANSSIVLLLVACCLLLSIVIRFSRENFVILAVVRRNAPALNASAPNAHPPTRADRFDRLSAAELLLPYCCRLPTGPFFLKFWLRIYYRREKSTK